MDEGTATETIPDLKDIEVKIGRKTPEGLLRWMREEASTLRGEAKLTAAHETSKETGKKSLDEKIRKLKMEMAHLRIEAVKWLMEERSTLTSRCSSLTSSQYSLGEGPDTSWRGSWSSLQDPNDKLDNISIGSYLDTWQTTWMSTTQGVKVNGVLEKPTMQTGNPTRPSLKEKLGTNPSPKLKPYKNGKIDLDTCKMNGKMHLEYDAHWRWVQSQEDVTFL
uniref:Leucine rich adaptor protein 1 n=1 Tax=Labrus bergylta TaxID=56723 RepID=A0A3Q3EP40_9LABR